MGIKMVSNIYISPERINPIPSNSFFKSNNNQNYEHKTSTTRKFNGYFAGIGIYLLINKVVFKKSISLIENFSINNRELIKLDKAKYLSELMVQKNNLPDKIGIYFIDESDKARFVSNNIRKNSSNKTWQDKIDHLLAKINVFKTKYPDGFLRTRNNNMKIKKIERVIKNKNAICNPEKFVLSGKRNSFEIFHEIGHVINYYSTNKLVKLLLYSKSRLPRYVVLPTLGLTLIHKRKKEENKTRFDKAFDFVKNNCGLIVFSSYIPMILEEGLASARGLNFLKKSEQITKAEFKAIRNHCAFALSTYIFMGALSMLAVQAASFARDKVVYKKDKH